ncbi:MAG TPA: hypothetical protein VFL61_14880 [Gaiellaceae bacterium]|nr:hypothetical protein [Gaiellaceae bacterium]
MSKPAAFMPARSGRHSVSVSFGDSESASLSGRRTELARWRIPAAGFLLALMGGASYAWGVFVYPLVARFG